jgi:hypothetical protein
MVLGANGSDYARCWLNRKRGFDGNQKSDFSITILDYGEKADASINQLHLCDAQPGEHVRLPFLNFPMTNDCPFTSRIDSRKLPVTVI